MLREIEGHGATAVARSEYRYLHLCSPFHCGQCPPTPLRELMVVPPMDGGQRPE
jgi:hypothetical protein